MANNKKSAIVLSPNTSDEAKQLVIQASKGTIDESFEKYLGLPYIVSRWKYKSFRWIKDKVWQKIQGWKNKLLSQDGREILIKAVIQALPIYITNVYRLQQVLCRELLALMSRY